MVYKMVQMIGVNDGVNDGVSDGVSAGAMV